jgi:hypothetical protein
MSLLLKAAKSRSLGRQGDPGFFGTIGKAIGGLAKGALGLAASPVTGPVGTAVKVMQGIGGMKQPMKLPLLPGGGAGFFARQPDFSDVMGGGSSLTKAGQPRRIRSDGKPWKRPSMNFANGRAIRRAARRLEGAEKMFKKVFTIRHGGHAPAVRLKGKGR